MQELNARNRTKSELTQTKRTPRDPAEGSLAYNLQATSSSKGLNILTMVGLIELCSNNSATGFDRPRLQAILAEAQCRPSVPAPESVRRWTRLGPAQRLEIVRRYEEGLTSIALAAEYGVSKSTILSTLRASNAVVRRQPLTRPQVAKAAELYRAGSSLPQVATRLSLKQDTIRLALRREGVELRPRTGA